MRGKIMKTMLLAGVAALPLATGTAQAGDKEYYVAACLGYATPKEDGDDCFTISATSDLKACKVLRQVLIEQNLIVSRCTRTEKEAKAELATIPRSNHK
jgi:hypothetical protein